MKIFLMLFIHWLYFMSEKIFIILTPEVNA